MKVKTIKNYYDRQLKEDISAGADMEVADGRGGELIAAGVAVAQEETAPAAPEPTPEPTEGQTDSKKGGVAAKKTKAK